MSGRQNKFRSNTHADKGNIWQRVVKSYQKHGPFKKNITAPMYEDGDTVPSDDQTDEDAPLEIPYWSILSYLLYIALFLLILYPCVMMWIAQPHPNPQSRLSEQEAPALSQRIKQSKGSAVTFTEQELNIHLAQECNIIQRGGYSILAHPDSLMIRIHDGYAELIFDRMLGIDFHHTIAVNISFTREEEKNYSGVTCHLCGGEPILDRFPRGGAIGSLAIPERFMQMMIPPLKRLLYIHPELQELVEEQGYLPEFSTNEQGQGILQLTPPDQQLLSTNN